MEIPLTSVVSPVLEQHNVLQDVVDSPLFWTIAVTLVAKQVFDINSSNFMCNPINTPEAKRLRERNNAIASTLIGATSATLIKFFT